MICVCDTAISIYPLYFRAGIYCIGNHPVLGVHVMGDVVSSKEKSSLIIYEGNSICNQY